MCNATTIYLSSTKKSNAGNTGVTTSTYLFDIETTHDLAVWKRMLTLWKEKYGYLLTEKTIAQEEHIHSWWYTHGNLRRAMKLLQFDESNLFAYLTYSFLPKTNNSLEGLNSQIKSKLSNHRGMKTPQQVIYIFWLLTFSRVKTRKDLKQLWDRLKTKIFRSYVLHEREVLPKGCSGLIHCMI